MFSDRVLHTLPGRVSLLAPIQAMPGSTSVNRSFTTVPDDSCIVWFWFEGPPYGTFCVDFAMDLSFELDPDVDSDAAQAAHPSNRRDQYCTGRCIPVGFGSASDSVQVDPLASNRRVQNCRARCIPAGGGYDNVRFDAAASDTCWKGKR